MLYIPRLKIIKSMFKNNFKLLIYFNYYQFLVLDILQVINFKLFHLLLLQNIKFLIHNFFRTNLNKNKKDHLLPIIIILVN